MELKRWLMVGVLTAPGCAATFEQLQARAALDFECQPAAISGRRVDDHTMVASGCGKQAIRRGNLHRRQPHRLHLAAQLDGQARARRMIGARPTFSSRFRKRLACLPNVVVFSGEHPPERSEEG